MLVYSNRVTTKRRSRSKLPLWGWSLHTELGRCWARHPFAITGPQFQSNVRLKLKSRLALTPRDSLCVWLDFSGPAIGSNLWASLGVMVTWTSMRISWPVTIMMPSAELITRNCSFNCIGLVSSNSPLIWHWHIRQAYQHQPTPRLSIHLRIRTTFMSAVLLAKSGLPGQTLEGGCLPITTNKVSILWHIELVSPQRQWQGAIRGSGNGSPRELLYQLCLRVVRDIIGRSRPGISVRLLSKPSHIEW